MSDIKQVIMAIRAEFREARRATSQAEKDESIAEIRELVEENRDLLGMKHIAQIENNLDDLEGRGESTGENEMRSARREIKLLLQTARSAKDDATRDAAIEDLKALRAKHADTLGGKQLNRLDKIIDRLEDDDDDDDDDEASFRSLRRGLKGLKRAGSDEERAAALEEVKRLRSEHGGRLGRKGQARLDAHIERAEGRDDYGPQHDVSAETKHISRTIRQALRTASRSADAGERADALQTVTDMLDKHGDEMTPGQIARIQKKLAQIG